MNVMYVEFIIASLIRKTGKTRNKILSIASIAYKFTY